MSNQTAEPTEQNQTLVLNFANWDAAKVAAFVVACEAMCRTLRREGHHEQVAEAFETMAVNAGALVRLKAEQEGQQRARHSLN